MNDLDVFKGLVDDLIGRKTELHQHIQEFQNLSVEVSDLQRRAPTDANAQQKIQRLQAIMDDDFFQHRALLVEKINSVTESMQELAKILQLDDIKTGEVHSSGPVKTGNASKKTPCFFV